MTVEEFLNQATNVLQGAGIETARLEALILLEDALKRDRSLLLAHPESKIPDQTEVELNNRVMQRTMHIPLAYIRGKAPFYGREFTIHSGTLVPRPETEAMIGLLKASHFGLPHEIVPLQIADVGTGTGCLGITAALEFPGSQAALYDIDALTLGLAARNAKDHGIRASIHHEDLLSHAGHRRYDAILANLPYIPLDYQLNAAARHEPKIAIFSGNDGLDAYRRFWKQVKSLHWQPAHIFTESLTPQHHALTELAKDASYRLAQTQGLVQQFSRA